LRHKPEALRVQPCFNLTRGCTLCCLSVIVRIPLPAVFIRAPNPGLAGLRTVATAVTAPYARRGRFGRG